MRFGFKYVAFIFLVMFFYQCKTIKPIHQDQFHVQLDSLKIQIETDSLLNSHFVGFQLMDTLGTALLSLNEKKYFTPASTIKLFSYLASRLILDDTLLSLAYRETGDSLIVRGMADPSFLNADYHVEQSAYNFLSASGLKKYIDFSHFKDTRFGKGWAWDDYAYSFQVEKSALPVFGNNLIFRPDSLTGTYKIIPEYYADSLVFQKLTGMTGIQRKQTKNQFSADFSVMKSKTDIYKPFIAEDGEILSILSSVMDQEIKVLEFDERSYDWKYIKGPPTDSLYKNLLFFSDNFVAEQLLLMCSQNKLGYMNTEKVLGWIQDSLFTEMPDKIRWVDGSGLSRYNLVTPRSLTWTLREILKLDGYERAVKFLPFGNADDTLDEIFSSEGVFVHAKTGTLSNNFNLAGYLKCDSGKVFIFCFMNNHYIYNKSKIIPSIYKILKYIKVHF